MCSGFEKSLGIRDQADVELNHGARNANSGIVFCNGLCCKYWKINSYKETTADFFTIYRCACHGGVLSTRDRYCLLSAWDQRLGVLDMCFRFRFTGVLKFAQFCFFNPASNQGHGCYLVNER